MERKKGRCQDAGIFIYSRALVGASSSVFQMRADGISSWRLIGT